MSVVRSLRRVEAGELGFTLVELRGAQPGPVVAVLGGVHGDEPEGVASAHRLIERLERAPLRGTVLLVPVCNEAAFAACARRSPGDGGDLARSFPGDARGAPTARLAAALHGNAIEPADALVDLHSAGVHYAMPRLAGFVDDGSETSRTAERLALSMGLPVVWRHRGEPPPGRTLTAAHAAGIPAVYTETGGGGVARGVDVGAYVRGVTGLLEALELLPRNRARIASRPLRLAGAGDLDAAAIRAPRTGLVEPCVRTLDEVVAGDPVAHVLDPVSGERTAACAERDGTVVLMRRTGSIAAGESLCHLAEPDAGVGA
ncbi:MAG TPA: M14 family metallopeptidase [Conexibacter sp.]|jgi:predicted deacylase|nr:M14 family metallopeptidase [Conexibacter sp.]